MALITLRNIELSFGLKPLLDKACLSIDSNQRIALIGRNGAGKSSFLKLMQGSILPDSGEIVREQGVKIFTLEQEVPQDTVGSVFDIVLSGLGDAGRYLSEYDKLSQSLDMNETVLDKMSDIQHKIDELDAWGMHSEASAIISKLELDPLVEFSSLSGGLKRRVLLAKALVCKPDLLLLDEPTNHLDIESIGWLEGFLPTYKGAILCISHDRAFLKKIATSIVEIDRGKLIAFNGDYEAFLKHKEYVLNAEAQQNALFDKKLAQEEVWVRQGIKARRTRNEGRVRALEKMRQERQSRRVKQGTSAIQAFSSERSGKKVLEVENVRFQYEDKIIFKNFSTELWRGDKIALLGPNGCGKSTLLKVMLGKLSTSEGKVSLGTNLEVAYFDQLRGQLDDGLSIQDNVGAGSDFIELNGQKKHILSYLQDFLFTPERARAPISALSGGERNRVLLAKILSKPSNVLVLDEPTNDLDIETLEVLEEMLVNYQGTIILVSHDRDFIDNIVTSTIVFESDGVVREYVGGYSDWVKQSKALISKVESTIKSSQSKPEASKGAKKGLSYKEKMRLEELPKVIEEAEEYIGNLTLKMSEADFYKGSKEDISEVNNRLAIKKEELEQLYIEWDSLEALS
jgi:ABC transport system ATP-binding/permease protein